MVTEYINLSRWLDSHKVSIDELGTDSVADACYSALHDILRSDNLSQFIQNNKGYVASELIDDICDIDEEQCVRMVKEYLKHYNIDWRELIKDSKEEYDLFFEEHDTEFEEWLRNHKKLGDEEDMKDENYYLSEGIDDFLDFAAEYLFGGRTPSIDNIDEQVLENADFDAFVESHTMISDYDLYGFVIYVYIDLIMDEDWFTEWIVDKFGDSMDDYISPDDYYPMWNYAWEFPASYSAEELNEDMEGIGLIFFELNGVVYVSLGTVGMSMMPSLYYAYAIYSDIYVDPKKIAQDIVSHGVGYYKYVIGEKRLIELAEHIGYDLQEIDNISKTKYEQFNKTLDTLRSNMEEGKIDKLEAALLGLMAINETPEVKTAKIH